MVTVLELFLTFYKQLSINSYVDKKYIEAQMII